MSCEGPAPRSPLQTTVTMKKRTDMRDGVGDGWFRIISPKVQLRLLYGFARRIMRH